jgi:hypothetical protein
MCRWFWKRKKTTQKLNYTIKKYHRHTKEITQKNISVGLQYSRINSFSIKDQLYTKQFSSKMVHKSFCNVS